MSGTPVNMLENLKVKVLASMLKDQIGDWIRTDETVRFNRMYFFLQGEGSIEINRHLYFPRPNQLFILPAGTVQTFRTSPDNPYIRFYCDFYAAIGEWPLFQHAEDAYWADIPDREGLLRTFRELSEQHTRSSPSSYLLSQAALIRLIAICMDQGNYGNFVTPLLTSTEQNKLTHTLHYIQENLAQPITVDDLANLAHLHPNYFISFFKKHMGVSPMHYVQRKRLDKARQLLSTSDLPISEIAEAVGMDFMNFSKQFKRETGVSPSNFRSHSR
jgi:AraC-like DNA-binding protein